MELPNKFNLKGKTALVTGAAGLLGKQHVLALLECGANVIATDVKRNLEDEYFELVNGSPLAELIRFQQLDVTNEEQILATVTKFQTDGISVNILVNNAAIDSKVTSGSGVLNSSRLENFKVSDWNDQINVGLTGAFLCAKFFGGQMVRSRTGGVILNIASDLSVIAPNQGLYHDAHKQEWEQEVKPVTYSVVKTGMVGLTAI